MATDIAGRTRASTILSWILVLLVLALLVFIIVGPQFRNPRIDQTIRYWRENYFTLASFVTIAFACALLLRSSWREFRDERDLWALGRVIMYAVYFVFFSCASTLLAWQHFLGRA